MTTCAATTTSGSSNPAEHEKFSVPLAKRGDAHKSTSA